LEARSEEQRPRLKRPLAIFSLAFASATAFWQILLPDWYFMLGPLVLLLVATMLLGPSFKREAALLVTFGYLLGFMWCVGHDVLFLRPARELDRERSEITVYVTGLPRETPYFTDVMGRLVREDGLNIPMTLRLDEASGALAPGNTIVVEAMLHRADYVQGQRIWRHNANGIYLRGFATGAYTVVDRGRQFWYFPQYASAAVVAQVSRVFREDAVGFVVAMLIGDLSGMDRQAYANIRESGIAHVLAVSGMHVVFLTSMLAFLLGRNRRAALFSIPIIYLFTLMTGANPSVIRAAVMQTFLLAAPLFSRESDGVTSLSASLFFILLFNPLAIASINLQLSFLAVVGMFAVMPRIHAYLDKRFQVEGKFASYVKKALIASLATTFGATLVTTPAIVFHFGTVSLYAALTNLLTVFPSSLVFFGGILASTVGIFALPLAQVIALPVEAISHYIEWVAQMIAGLPMAVVVTHSSYIRVWLAVVAAISAFYFFYRGEKPKPSFPVSLCVGLLVFALFLGRLEVRSDGLTVTVLDVGQGQTVVLTTPEMTTLVDCGSGRGFRAGHIAAEYLFGRSRYSIDFLILTHFHQDHINGVAQLLQRMPVERMLMPERPEGMAAKDRILALAEEFDVSVYMIRSDRIYPSDMGTMTVFAPFTTNIRASENNRGLSVLKTVGEFDVLVTGDMYTDMEQRLVQLHDLPDIEVLVVGHHGSQTSTSVELLTAVLPEVAVISVGRDNQYGHPHREVLVRLYQFGSSIYRTDRSGTVTVRSN